MNKETKLRLFWAISFLAVTIRLMVGVYRDQKKSNPSPNNIPSIK